MTDPHLMAKVPSWTGVLRDDGRAVSPLGLDVIGAAMVSRFQLPGITNGTIHARYFSFLAWVVDSFRDHGPSQLTGKAQTNAWRQWVLSMEQAWRLCSVHASPETTGIIGRETADRTPLSARMTVPLPVEAPCSLEAQYYGASFRALEFARPAVGGLLTLTSKGEEAYRAFDSSLRTGASKAEKEALAALLRVPQQMKTSHLATLSGRFSVRALRASEPEAVAITRVLTNVERTTFNDALPTLADHARALCLGLVLEIYGQADGSLEGPDAVLDVFAQRELPDGRAVKALPSGLAQSFASWECFMERQFQKTAIEAFWHELLMYLEGTRGVSPRSAVERLTRLVGDSAELKSMLGARPLDKTVADLEAAALELAPKRRAAWARHLTDLSDRIVNRAEDQPIATERLGAALRLLSLSAHGHRATWTGRSPLHQGMHSYRGAERLGLPWMAAELDRRREHTLRDFVGWLVEWCVVGQATRIAYEKLDQGDRFIVRLEEGMLCIAGPEANFSGYFAKDPARLHGATGLLLSLGLLRNDGGLIPTQAGNKLRLALSELPPLSTSDSVLDDLAEDL